MAEVPTLRRRMPPPAALGAREARSWESVTACRAPDFFDGGSAPLLTAYCRAVAAQDAIAAALAQLEVITTPEAVAVFLQLSARMDVQVKLTIRLASSMRLSQQSGRSADAGKTAQTKGASSAELWSRDATA